jgi:hypothetical protein
MCIDLVSRVQNSFIFVSILSHKINKISSSSIYGDCGVIKHKVEEFKHE